MQASRLLSILMLLQSRGRSTAAELARQLDVSERTILRDMDQLSAAGVPVWSERGRDGGFRLRDGWSTQLTGLTGNEANAFLLAGLPGPATALGLGAAATSARLKMIASLPTVLREQAIRVGERLHVDPSDWYRADDAPACLLEVAAAVWQSRTISVHYESWRGASRRKLEPIGLVLKAGAWYLAARTPGHDEPATYRLATMTVVAASGPVFRRSRRFDLAQWWQRSSARFESRMRPLQARLRATSLGEARLANDRTVTVVAANGSGGRELLLPIESIEHGARQLLALGAEVEVVEPNALREELRKLAQRVAALYAETEGVGGNIATAAPALVKKSARRRS